MNDTVTAVSFANLLVSLIKKVANCKDVIWHFMLKLILGIKNAHAMSKYFTMKNHSSKYE